MFVFLVLMLVLMRLCLCLCASDSIRQIGELLVIFLFILHTLMSRVFSLVMLMLCLCYAYALVRTTVSFMTAMTWTLVFSVPCEK